MQKQLWIELRRTLSQCIYIGNVLQIIHKVLDILNSGASQAWRQTLQPAQGSSTGTFTDKS